MIDLFKYRLPFKTPFHTAGGTLSYREGILIHYRGSECDAVSEIAPLPGISKESTADAQSCLTVNFPKIHRLLQASETLRELSAGMETLDLPPSVQFGISTAGTALIAQRSQTPVHHLLDCKLNSPVRVNAVIGLQHNKRELLDRIEASYHQGYRTLKLKCGNPPGLLPEAIRTASARFPDLHFRVDANRSWPADRAKEYFTLFDSLPVEYFEEPVAITHPGQLRELRALSPVPIALDESVRTREQLNQFLYRPDGIPADILVLKPMLFGNILDLFETIRRHNSLLNKPDTRSHKTNMKTNWILTTSFESGVGRKILESIAGMIGTPEYAHGLDTGRYFENDLLPLSAGQAVYRPESSTNWGVDFKQCNSEYFVHLQSYEP
ncbi:MAG: enolase C-terminal domain-like protein [Balneolaceae bacterium]